jgi:mRNA-degrading endonuclease toxin of MazEF toxin-antitoxin module
MQRGEIWVGSFRPCCGIVLALPLTSQFWTDTAALRIEVAPRQRLKKLSCIMIEQMRSLNPAAMGEGPLAELTHDEMIMVETRLCLGLGMD